MQVLPAATVQQQKRLRLKRNTLYASIIVLIGGCFGFVDRLAERLAPKPDYYKLFFTELARQATLATGTPTIIKQDEDTLKFFENEYNRRNAKLGLAEGKVVPSDKGLLQFSYAPGMIEQLGPGLSLMPSSEILRTNARPVIWEDEEGMRPLVVWTYSKRETLLACFVYQLLTADHPLVRRPPSPDLRIIQNIDWKGVVSVQGSIPKVKVFPEHAYLLPLGDMKLENLDPRAQEMPNLAVPYLALPMVAVRATMGRTVRRFQMQYRRWRSCAIKLQAL